MKNIKLVSVGIMSALALSLVSCETNTGKGAAIGAGTGALAGGIIGHQSGNTTQGALIGAGVGAGTGALIGRQKDKREANNNY